MLGVVFVGEVTDLYKGRALLSSLGFAKNPNCGGSLFGVRPIIRKIRAVGRREINLPRAIPRDSQNVCWLW